MIVVISVNGMPMEKLTEGLLSFHFLFGTLYGYLQFTSNMEFWSPFGYTIWLISTIIILNN